MGITPPRRPIPLQRQAEVYRQAFLMSDALTKLRALWILYERKDEFEDFSVVGSTAFLASATEFLIEQLDQASLQIEDRRRGELVLAAIRQRIGTN